MALILPTFIALAPSAAMAASYQEACATNKVGAKIFVDAAVETPPAVSPMVRNVETVPQVLDMRLVVVVGRKEVGQKSSVRVHREIIRALNSNDFLQLDLPVLHFEGLHCTNPCVVTFLILKPFYILLHQGESHEAHLDITVDSVLDFVQRPCEGLHVVCLTISDDQSQHCFIRLRLPDLTEVIQRCLQNLCHGSSSTWGLQKDSVNISYSPASGTSIQGV